MICRKSDSSTVYYFKDWNATYRIDWNRRVIYWGFGTRYQEAKISYTQFFQELIDWYDAGELEGDTLAGHWVKKFGIERFRR